MKVPRDLAITLAFLLAAAYGLEAHKPITSRYTYNDDVFPILRDRCGRCHVDGGPTPMSLMTYADALPWAESMREMLVAQAMPPWYVDPLGPPVRNNHELSARELDIIVTWAMGGTPRGKMEKNLPPVVSHAQWMLGPPDLAIPMEQAYTVAAGKTEGSGDVTLATNLKEARWVNAADLLPGTPSMVRRAIISVVDGPVLAVWQPGLDPVAAPSGTAFKLPAGAKLRLQIHYKKPWQEEQQPKSDLSTIGLYFTDEPLSGRAIQAWVITAPTSDPTEPRVLHGSMLSGGRVLAVRTLLDHAYQSLDVQVKLPNGRSVPLLKLRAPRPEWPLRYWLVDPVELPAGAKIEVTAAPAGMEQAPVTAPPGYPFEIALDLVPQ